MRTTHALACLAVLLFFAASASAQTLYKLVRPDGRIEYTDKPTPDAMKVERYDLVPNAPDPERAAAQRAEDERRARLFDERERKRATAFDKADAEIKAAMQALRLAQQRLQDGEAPLPAELTGTASGFARHNAAYFERMQKLNKDVADATLRLDRAYTTRNAMRD